jgi:hypothetical protein
MVIENAPFLERLLVSDLEGPTKIRVIDAPKLTALVYSSAKFSELVIGSIIIQVRLQSRRFPQPLTPESEYTNCQTLVEDETEREAGLEGMESSKRTEITVIGVK